MPQRAAQPPAISTSSQRPMLGPWPVQQANFSAAAKSFATDEGRPVAAGLESPRGPMSPMSLSLASHDSPSSCRYSPYADANKDWAISDSAASPSESSALASPTNTLVALASVAIADHDSINLSCGGADNCSRAAAVPAHAADLALGTPYHNRSHHFVCGSRRRHDFSRRASVPNSTGAQTNHWDYEAGSACFSRDMVANQHNFGGSPESMPVNLSLSAGVECSPGGRALSVVSDGSTDTEPESMLNRGIVGTMSKSSLVHHVASQSEAIRRDPQQPGAPLLPPQEAGANQAVLETGPRCSYTENCTTGSPLRKVVSHIFGRNKLCTRQIPKGAWVHYCRKHYQRSRYRNPRGFALLQCELVRKQIDRLQLWGGVVDWIVKVRKREEERLNRETAQLAAAKLVQASRRGSGRSAAAGAAEVAGRHDRDANDYDAAVAAAAAATVASHAEPAGPWAWLAQHTGPGKSTADVLSILARIEREIAESGSNFPDVEVLPNVVDRNGGGGAGASSASGPVKQNAAAWNDGGSSGSGRPSSANTRPRIVSSLSDAAADAERVADSAAVTASAAAAQRKRKGLAHASHMQALPPPPPLYGHPGVSPSSGGRSMGRFVDEAQLPGVHASVTSKRPRLRGGVPEGLSPPPQQSGSMSPPLSGGRQAVQSLAGPTNISTITTTAGGGGGGGGRVGGVGAAAGGGAVVASKGGARELSGYSLRRSSRSGVVAAAATAAATAATAATAAAAATTTTTRSYIPDN